MNKEMTTYQIYSDGGARGNPGPAGVGFVLKKEGEMIEKFHQYIGSTTNNKAEYKAAIMGAANLLDRLGPAKAANVKVQLFSDSELVVKQVTGEYDVKDKTLRPFCNKLKDLLTRFSQYEINHIPREFNSEADNLVNKAIDEEQS